MPDNPVTDVLAIAYHQQVHRQLCPIPELAQMAGSHRTGQSCEQLPSSKSKINELLPSLQILL